MYFYIGLLILFPFGLLSFCTKENKGQGQGKFVQEKSKRMEFIKYYKKYEVDEWGRIQYSGDLKAGGEKGFKHVRVYTDSRGRILRQEDYGEHGKLLRYSAFEYKGVRLFLEKGFDPEQELIYERKYNRLGHVERENKYVGGVYKEYILYRYEKVGSKWLKFREDHYYIGGGLKFYKVFQYGVDGQIERIHYYSPKGELISKHQTFERLQNY